MRTSIKNIANKAGVTGRYIAYLLDAERDASPKTAVRLERATGINRTIWTFGSKIERRRAWKKMMEAKR